MTERINVLVTPAGSRMAVVAIKALKQDPSLKIVASDINPLAAGLHLAHKGYLVPPISDPKFFSATDLVIEKEEIDVVIPCLDTFLLPFAKRKAFEEKGVKVIISPEKTIEICRDKWRTYTALRDTIPMPKSTIDFSNLEETCNYVRFPALLKPRSGSGSENIHVVRDENDLIFYLRKVDDPLLQRQIDGEEYTVDMLVDRDRKPLAVVPRKRIEVKAGVSVKGAIDLNSALIEIGRRICEKLEFFGPVNFQAIIDKKDEIPKVTEINPRISGGMSLTIASGVNIPLLSVYLAMGKTVDIKPPEERVVYMSRYYEEIMFKSEPVENLEDFR